eukprot:CAMPEP_0179991216 /NCGR_PEP_ID=MMETSP0984-20121128/4868_1 /TAXON_ID=483367 /ORGANISM="non described non described, Strain CCMP 2436" /LENGTH=125 /DNA_ID=CAMNT_0021910495 /DNA_START=370 /DNA_END=747 /DNA_ORIENTATION=+
MYVFGGEDSLNDLWGYALDTCVWTQVVSAGESAPCPRTGYSLVPLGNRLMVFGGINHVSKSLNSVLHCFDLQQRRWSILAVGGEHPRARKFHAAIPCGGGFLIFGGADSGDKPCNDHTVLLRVWP